MHRDLDNDLYDRDLDDGLNAARGIILGIPLGGVLWLIILSPFWLLSG